MNVEDQITQKGIEVQKDYTIKEIVVVTQLSSVWVRRSITKKKRLAKKIPNEKGVLVWRMDHKELVKWIQDLYDKDQKKIKRIDNYTFERRPSEMSCNMITRKVTSDTTLTRVQKDLFISKIEKYRQEWRKEYETRKNKK